MGIAERRERERRRRRTEIIDAAEEVFFAKGIDDATMDDVAEAAELSKGTLYLYFESKEDLYFAIAARGIEVLHGLFSEAVREQPTGMDKLNAIGYAYYDYYKTYPDYFQAVLHHEHNTTVPAEATSNERLCLSQGRAVHGLMANVVQEGIDDGTIRPELHPQLTALTLWGAATGIIQIMAHKSAMLASEEVSDDLLYTYFVTAMGFAMANVAEHT
ncbi:MAG: TetR/AcrR family transcriptional regulator [Bacteroidota bacterium]